MFKRVLIFVVVLGCLGVCLGRSLKGVSQMGAELKVSVPGDRDCPISAENAKKISDAYKSPLIIVVVEVDNTKGMGGYHHYYRQSSASVGSDSVTPADIFGTSVPDLPYSITQLFLGGDVAKGEVKSYAIAFPVPQRGSSRLKNVLLRTAVSDEWVMCE